MKAPFQRQNTIIIHFIERAKEQKHLVNSRIDSEHKMQKTNTQKSNDNHKRKMLNKRIEKPSPYRQKAHFE